MSLQLYPPSDWYRQGRGHVLQFFATESEIQTWINEGLAQEWGPYSVTCSAAFPHGDTFRDKVMELPVHNFFEATEHFPHMRFEWCIRSHQLLPPLPNMRWWMDLVPLCSLSGFLLLQHHRRQEIESGEILHYSGSAFCVVSGVSNRNDGTVVRHADNVKIWQKLKRRVVKDLRYGAIAKLQDGMECPQEPIVRMTEGAVRLYEAGLPMSMRPGPFLKQPKRP